MTNPIGSRARASDRNLTISEVAEAVLTEDDSDSFPPPPYTIF